MRVTFRCAWCGREHSIAPEEITPKAAAAMLQGTFICWQCLDDFEFYPGPGCRQYKAQFA